MSVNLTGLAIVLSSLLWGCNQQSETAVVPKQLTEYVKDPHSFAEPQKVTVTHLDLTLNVNFDKKILIGTASWTIVNNANADQIVLDTRQMHIKKVSLNDKQETTYSLGNETKYLGKSLKIKIKPDTKKVTIHYETEKNAAALQWLNPQQTAGKQFPFLFTQSQAILARTWIPCQDSPGIKFTYKAHVTVPKNLLALMSAKNPIAKSDSGIYHFDQPNKISSYLMALAVGNIAYKSITPQTGVYAEPVMLEKASYEFADMGTMVSAAEKLYGAYRWQFYNVLVLPPSFPFGGMENPMLTFATPTVIAGDRSLVNLIAHELAHSWSGNLVTNATWNDFWLNEGFTVYFERRIIEEVFGKDEKEMQEVLGFEDLKEEVAALGANNADTRLKTDFTGRDPDEGVTTTAYEKGYSFLRKLEELTGREKLDNFLKTYFNEYAFKAMTTENFLRYLDKNLLKGNKELASKLDIAAWIYTPGISANAVKVKSARFTTIDSVMRLWKTNKNIPALKSQLRSTNELLYFIRNLPANTTVKDLALLNKVFSFNTSANAEIQCVWYTLAIKKNYRPAYPHIETFLTTIGRRKFLVPIYKELLNRPQDKAWAKKVYANARPNYHSVAYNTIDELMK